MSTAHPRPEGPCPSSDASGPTGGWVAPGEPNARLAVISSEALLRGQASINITHQGAIYRLQTTRQGKLILTK